MTRYWLDTEFIDTGSVIELISIGILSEDGREYYAQSSGFDAGHADPWIWENVFPHLTMCHGNSSYQATNIAESLVVHNHGKCDLSIVHNMPDECPWRSRLEMRDEVYQFIHAGGDKSELIGWCAAYDFVALCQLFGTMMALPATWPHYIKDIQSILDVHGLADEALPQQEEGLHNALADARHIKRLWEWLNGRYLLVPMRHIDHATTPRTFDYPVM